VVNYWPRWRVARLERRLAAAFAQWVRDGRPLVVLPPDPPCPTGHLETVTIPDLLGGDGMMTACAHCKLILDQPPPVPDCTNPTGGHRFPAYNMPGETARGGPCIHCDMPFPKETP
jgi:hypothetical protein